MTQTAGVAALVLAMAAAGGAQPAFEVASVKPDTSGRQGNGRQPNVRFDPGSLTLTNASLKTALAWAYHVFPYQVSGPGWLDDDRYDFAAKTASASSESQIRQMLQQLLAERFQVALHHETKEMPAYILTVGKNGVKFKESEGDGEMELGPTARMGFEVKRASMAQIADLLGYSPFPDPIVDETGLKGKYDMSMDMQPYLMMLGDGPKGIEDVIPILIQAVQEQLGLKVEHRKAPIDMLMVDHAERTPTEN